MIKFPCLITILILPIFAFGQSLDSIPKLTPQNHIKPFIIPAALISYGIVAKSDNFLNRFDKSIQRQVHSSNSNSSEIPEDILRYVPALAVYGLNFSGIKGKNNLIDASGIYLLSNVIMGGSVKITKRLTNHERPDGSDDHSFPSGHSASAFASAEFLRQEYKDVSPFYGYAGYTVAAATGILRLRHDKHWFGDVVAGAGFGIASTKLSYILYPEIKKIFSNKKTSNYVLLPSYQPQFVGLNFNAKF
jgi:membrane-associated phospholipid phosphatase